MGRIESAEIGSEIVEIHFACPNMSEAIVRPCTFSNGVGTVTIPDQCLEQANTITAWIFEIDGTQGHTIKTITLPVIARKRPSKSADVPAEYVDKYAELIAEVNEAVGALESGNVVVAKATNADNAAHATTAGNAESAVYATSANAANYVSRSLHIFVAEYNVTEGVVTAPTEIYTANVFVVDFVTSDNKSHSGLLFRAKNNCCARIGDYTMNLDATGDFSDWTITLTADGVEASEINGTLVLYKLGGVPQ